MKRWLFLAVLLFPLAAQAADTDSLMWVGKYNPTNDKGWPDSFKCLKVSWQGDGTDCTKANVALPSVLGRIALVVTDPGATAPADNYDIAILDAEGTDVMGGALNNRDTANSEHAIPLAGSLAIPGGRPVYGALTMTFTATANANCNGEVFVYYVE